MKKSFTYKNSIIYINDIKTKIHDFTIQLNAYSNDNRIGHYLFKVNNYIDEYIKEYNYIFQTKSAKVIQRAFRKYRYDPKYPFCERVQMNNLTEIYNEFNNVFV